MYFACIKRRLSSLRLPSHFVVRLVMNDKFAMVKCLPPGIPLGNSIRGSTLRFSVLSITSDSNAVQHTVRKTGHEQLNRDFTECFLSSKVLLMSSENTTAAFFLSPKRGVIQVVNVSNDLASSLKERWIQRSLRASFLIYRWKRKEIEEEWDVLPNHVKVWTVLRFHGNKPY